MSAKLDKLRVELEKARKKSDEWQAKVKKHNISEKIANRKQDIER